MAEESRGMSNETTMLLVAGAVGIGLILLLTKPSSAAAPAPAPTPAPGPAPTPLPVLPTPGPMVIPSVLPSIPSVPTAPMSTTPAVPTPSATNAAYAAGSVAGAADGRADKASGGTDAYNNHVVPDQFRDGVGGTTDTESSYQNGYTAAYGAAKFSGAGGAVGAVRTRRATQADVWMAMQGAWR